MRKTTFWMLAAVAMLAAAQAEPPYRKQDCEAQRLAKPAFIRCYAANFAAADAALATAYQAALARPGNDAAAIRDAERAWIVYKERECAVENKGDAVWRTNEDYGLRHTQCEIEMTERRIEELQMQLCEGISVCYPHVY